MTDVIFLIYLISLISAGVSLWVWYSNDNSRFEIDFLKKKYKTLEEEIESLKKENKSLASSKTFANKRR